MASKKTTKSKATNKSAWIRAQPSDKPAADVVATAKKAGISISAGLVYAVRSVDKGKAGKPAAVKAAKSVTARVAKSSASISGLGGLEGAIRLIVREELRALLSRV